jgi:hypothetical protein
LDAPRNARSMMRRRADGSVVCALRFFGLAICSLNDSSLVAVGKVLD